MTQSTGTKSRRVVGGAFALLVGGALAAAPASAADLVLDQRSGFVVPVEVNGHTLRLRVDPGANGVIVLNPALEERIIISSAGGWSQLLCFRSEPSQL